MHHNFIITSHFEVTGDVHSFIHSSKSSPCHLNVRLFPPSPSFEVAFYDHKCRDTNDCMCVCAEEENEQEEKMDEHVLAQESRKTAAVEVSPG